MKDIHVPCPPKEIGNIFNFTSSSRHQSQHDIFVCRMSFNTSVIRTKTSIYYRKDARTNHHIISRSELNFSGPSRVHPPDFICPFFRIEIYGNFQSGGIFRTIIQAASRSNVSLHRRLMRSLNIISPFRQHSKQEFYYLEKYHASTMDFRLTRPVTTRDWYNIKAIYYHRMMTDDKFFPSMKSMIVIALTANPVFKSCGVRRR